MSLWAALRESVPNDTALSPVEVVWAVGAVLLWEVGRLEVRGEPVELDAEVPVRVVEVLRMTASAESVSKHWPGKLGICFP